MVQFNIKALQKEGYVPPTAAGGMPPGVMPVPMPGAESMPPGAMPVPMAGAESMPLGAMPVPMAAGGAPPMPGAESMPMPVMLMMEDLQTVLQEASAGQDDRLSRLESIVEAVARKLDVPLPATDKKEVGNDLPAHLQLNEAPGSVMNEGFTEAAQAAAGAGLPNTIHQMQTAQ